MSTTCVNNERYREFCRMGYVSDNQLEKRLFLSNGFTVSIGRSMGVCERIIKIASLTLSCLTCCCYESCSSSLPSTSSLEEEALIKNEIEYQVARRARACCCGDGIDQVSLFIYNEEAGNTLRCQDYEHWNILDSERRFARRDLRNFVQQQLGQGKLLFPSRYSSQASYMLLYGPISGFSYVLIVPTDTSIVFCPLFPCCNVTTGEPCTVDELKARAQALCARYRSNMSPLRSVLDQILRDPKNYETMGAVSGIDSMLVRAQNDEEFED